MTSAPINRDKVEAALSWLQDEIAHREAMSERAKAFQRVIGHQAAANHLRTLLADHAAQVEENAELKGDVKTLVLDRQTFLDRAVAAEAQITAQAEAIKSLTEALDKYGEHSPGCRAISIRRGACSCGFYAALSNSLPNTGEQSQ